MATINSNLDSVYIDMSESLELYDKKIINGRKEQFLYALCSLDYEGLTVPLSRIELWLNGLITGNVPTIEPQSRNEHFLKAILTGDITNLPVPQSRVEVLLNKLANGETDLSGCEPIQSRYEFLLSYLIKNGGIGEDVECVTYEIVKAFETLYNTKEIPVKSAILKGSTKYRDIDTGEFLETFEEGRNLELVSVKMPILTTTGKNLFDMNHASYISGLIHVSKKTINQTGITKAYYIPCEPNTSYTISKMMTQYFRICETSVVPTFGCAISNPVNNPSKASLTITTSESAKYICFNVHNVNADTMDEYEVLATLQIEKGLVATSYEPYKTNILTVNEDVTLRSNGDICDELNLLTGQLTQRIDENNEVLAQEVVKTVDVTTVDQDGQPTKLKTFNDVTYIETKAESVLPTVSLEYATKNEEILSILSSEQVETAESQTVLSDAIDTQETEIQDTMVAVTEIYEDMEEF